MAISETPDFSILGIAEALKPLIRRHDDQSPNDVYIGQVVQPGGLSRANAYVKVFPKANTDILVLKEVIAHQVAAQCEIPSPYTFPCACERSSLRPATRAMIGRDSEYVLGVASIDGNPKRVRQILDDSEAAWADIMNWPQVARTAVFDELIGNGDRHVRNLVRCGLNDYLVIDNEHFLFEVDWLSTTDDLRMRRCDANSLADSIAEGTDEVMRQRMVRLAQNFVLQMSLTVPPNAAGLETLCHVPEGTVSRAIEILNARRTVLPTLMQWHVQKGQLFRMGSFR